MRARTCLRHTRGRAAALRTCHEDEDVTLGIPQVDRQRLLHGRLHVILLRGAAPKDVHREGPAGARTRSKGTT